MALLYNAKLSIEVILFCISISIGKEYLFSHTFINKIIEYIVKLLDFSNMIGEMLSKYTDNLHFFFFFFFFFVFLPFLGPLPQHMEVPRLGAESAL